METKSPTLSLTNVTLAIGLAVTLGGLVWQASGRDSALTNLALHTDQVEKSINERFTRMDGEAAARRADMRARLTDDERKTDTQGQLVAEINLHMAHLDANVDLLIKAVTAPPAGVRR